MARIVITGGAGFLGSWIARSLTEQGYLGYQPHEVVVLDDLSGGRRSNLTDPACPLPPFSGELLVVDLSREGDTRILRSLRPQILVHLAANAREGASQFQPFDVCRRNLLAFSQTLKDSILGGSLERVVLFSSMSVYGAQQAPFRETDRPQPVDVYGWNKYSMEEILKILAGIHDFEWRIIRPHNCFGPMQSLSDRFRNVIGIWMNQIMRKESMTIYGSGDQTRQFSYIENSLPCYKKVILEDRLPGGPIYNIGGTVTTSILEAADYVRRTFGEPDWPLVHLRERPLEVKHAYCNNSLAEEALGYQDRTSVLGGITLMAAWARTVGPREWRPDTLEIPSPKAPKWWLEPGKGMTKEKISQRIGGL